MVSWNNSPFSANLLTAFILISLVTCMRPSELLALRKKDLVPPLMPLLPCWSVVIAAFEAECLPRQERAMGRSSWSNAGFKGQQALAPAEVRKSGRADLEFRLHCSGEKVETVNRLSGTQRHDHAPNTSPDAAQAVDWRTTTTPSHAPKQAGNTRITC